MDKIVYICVNNKIMNKFNFLKIYNSPFQFPKIGMYLGKTAIGTPIFYPRRWVKSKKEGYRTAIPRKIGFDFVGLGWKTKWGEDDYRFEWNPIFSFVFFGFQFCVIWGNPESDSYWTAWLYYHYNTDKTLSKKERVEQCKVGFPLTWTRWTKDTKESIDYYPLILRKKYR